MSDEEATKAYEEEVAANKASAASAAAAAAATAAQKVQTAAGMFLLMHAVCVCISRICMSMFLLM